MTEDARNTLKFNEDEIKTIPLDQIEADKNQVRKEFDDIEVLAESIKTNGLIQPILITTGEKGKYRIVDGERRWKAFQMIMEQVKEDTELVNKYSSIRTIYVDEDTKLVGILGNIIRNSYNPMESAYAFGLLKKLLGKDGKDAKDDVVGEHIGKARNTVVEYNSLLKLPKKIQDKARLNSCVPVSILRVIARSKDSEDIKIAKYEEYHKEYSADKVTNNQHQTMPNRKVDAIRKRIVAVNEALEEIEFENVDDSMREKFIESLEITIETAQNLLDTLSQQQTAASASNGDKD